MQRFQTEIAMMMTLRHPNIVQIFGGCWPQEEDGGDRYCNLFSTCIVMEYCQMGSLFDTVLRYGNDIPWYPPNYSKDNGTDGDPMLAAIARAASSSKPSRTSLSSLESNVQYKLDWCRQIARGMAYLHSQKNPVMHRDLKCSNVLVSKGFTLKIADFGESRRRHKTFVLENMEVSTGVGGFGAAGGASKAASVALGE
jgi:serine/threonine protein kinase